MKNLSVFLLGLAVAASPAFIAIKASPAATTLKMVTVDPSTSTTVSAVPIFLKLVEEKSAGQLKVDWIGGPEITPGKKQPAAVQKGVVDLSVAWAYVLHVPAFRVAHLSLLTPAEERKSGFYDFLVGEFEKKGFRYLGRTTSGTPYVLVTTKKAEKPEDLKGLGFRTSGIYEPIIERAGGKKVKVASPEVYSALQQGLIDVRPAPMATVTASRLYEVLKYWVGPGFFPAGNTVLAMNLKAFNGLPPDLQKVLLDAMEETEHQLIAVKQREFDAAWAEAKQNGMQRIDWPKEASESFFNDVMDESWRRAAKTLGDELIRKVRPMMSK
jgi:TRAP-type C4-dicarboxylate transport system substrate-binding protein